MQLEGMWINVSSKLMRMGMQDIALKTGVPVNSIFSVRNNCMEYKPNSNSAFILLAALWEALNSATDYLRGSKDGAHQSNERNKRKVRVHKCLHLFQHVFQKGGPGEKGFFECLSESLTPKRLFSCPLDKVCVFLALDLQHCLEIR